ncbi:gfo/Idh/MocA family oxidoreductase [Cryobacterium melibiosiphilum]|uniref:Inositol 2-dehydrogenase n=1 Tax=Cryobacterium melibiosiphilum TaxID=995039 RepID=A0A3A5MMU4_9MICO|nr:Gfo/Idh/MocA family oxidoreductase [Cryobacterium melibiosiphilum]RJT89149.1 gfo/Idh/MocA family oxidoreductase [Cryobacterium melibiosiphilum]
MSELRIAVVGAGQMGADHINRITERIVGARVSVVVEPDVARGAAAAALAPGAVALTNFADALKRDDIDAVLVATPGQFHETVLLPALAAGLPILCEKPLTQDPVSSLRVLEAEQATGKQLIQVGFMRRFDREYAQLRALIESDRTGALLALHCAHRNPTTGEGYTDSMMITDSVVHEIDVVRFLTDSPIVSVEVKRPKRNSLAPSWLQDPILVLLETESGILADVEMNVNVQFGYQVRTEAVFEKGIAEIGRTAGLTLWQDGQYGGAEHTTFKTRFADAYDAQIQRWVTATKKGEIDGPSAWDGYLVAAACEAGVRAQETGERVEVEYVPRPAFYSHELVTSVTV